MKTSIINITTVVIFSLILIPLFAQKDYVGHYKTNFAEIGFFSSHIELSSDNSFKFELIGDMSYDYCEGTFKIYKDTIILSVDSNSINTHKFNLIDSLGNPFVVDFGDNYGKNRTLKYYHSSNKLYPIDRTTGKRRKTKNSKNKYQRFYLKKEKTNFYRWKKGMNEKS